MNTQSSNPAPHRARVGAVSYLNTKPLIATLGKLLAPHYELCLELPSRLATQLSKGEIDVGLIPAIEFFRGSEMLSDEDAGHSDYRIISNACIACRGCVRSVRLFFRVPPRVVKSIAIDEGSRTSVALALILLHERFGIRPQLALLPMTADPSTFPGDAVLVIGDRAMHAERFQGFVENWDLGNEWFQQTGLPFVFAMWVGRQSMVDACLASHFEQARDEGIQRIQSLSERYATQYGLSVDECIEYLSVNLKFSMNHDETQGLKAFYQKATALELVSDSRRCCWPIVSDLTEPVT